MLSLSGIDFLLFLFRLLIKHKLIVQIKTVSVDLSLSLSSAGFLQRPISIIFLSLSLSVCFYLKKKFFEIQWRVSHFSSVFCGFCSAFFLSPLSLSLLPLARSLLFYFTPLCMFAQVFTFNLISSSSSDSPSNIALVKCCFAVPSICPLRSSQ